MRIADDLAYLLSLNQDMPTTVAAINQQVLESAKFRVWPGAVSYHHTGDGGLIRHTAQVVRSCQFFKDEALAASPEGKGLDWPVLFTAALWHDYGKLWDYEKGMSGTWQGTEHQKWVGHLILSHHGRRQWGVPVEPDTREAHALHQADMASSRVFEP